LSFEILQACRLRHVKTEFISCPSCGRTLFDLQKVSARIRQLTGHLPGVKIAVMGCIVNGPGEMADADFGYVGAKPGKVDLYLGKQCVEKNVDEAIAPEKLVELIKTQGLWVEPLRDVSKN
jgi:(E)-4-hydroxy-3-methylbut-2-enyl-diphosphate synthase